MAALAGLLFVSPVLYAILLSGPEIIIRWIEGDAYHYLAIARKAHTFHLYTYDGVHVTNGFHPLWQYFLRFIFDAMSLDSHKAEAMAMMTSVVLASTIGVVLASAAAIRLTRLYVSGLLIVPGVFYMTVGVHVKTLGVWSTLDGMESAFSMLFGGILFFVMSCYVGASAREDRNPIAACRALGLVLPFLILSRLDDVFILPALLLALLFFEASLKERVIAGLWIAAPSTVLVIAYMTYNKITAGSAMPLSGSTKSGFVGFLSTYLTVAIHFPPILDLKASLTKTSSDGSVVFLNGFRFVEMIYPMFIALFSALAAWRLRKTRSELLYTFVFAISLYIIFKELYNYINVHPWHQANWYYVFISLCISIISVVFLQSPLKYIQDNSLARYFSCCIYISLALLIGSQNYADFIYQGRSGNEMKFWARHDEIRKTLVEKGVRGIINVDDGISAFLLDFPAMHGLGLATDIEAQRAYKAGRMLSLANARGINAIAGFYMMSDVAPTSDAEIRSFLRSNLAFDVMKAEIDDFDFSLVYFDRALRLPFIVFKPKGG